MSDTLIEIKDLKCRIDNQNILQGLNLKINKGEVHAIMGPNGSGKSTLSSVLAGNDNYEITNGSITFLGEDITEMSPEERSWKGMFLAFQYPVEIPGVSNINFLRTAFPIHILKNEIDTVVHGYRMHVIDECKDIVPMYIQCTMYSILYMYVLLVCDSC